MKWWVMGVASWKEGGMYGGSPYVLVLMPRLSSRELRKKGSNYWIAEYKGKYYLS